MIPECEDKISVDAPGDSPWQLTYNRRAWSISGVIKFYPTLIVQFKQTPLIGAHKFYHWYNWESNSYMYALGDRSLLIPRLTLRSGIGSLSGKELDKDGHNIFEVLAEEGLICTGS